MSLRLTTVAALTVAAALGQQITVYSSGNLPVGQSVQLTAYVPLAVTTVNWSVNGIAGGNSTVGTVTAKGLYTAPMVVPAMNAVTVQATSTADVTKFGTVTITITQTPVQLWSISPTSVPAGAFTISLNGATFGSNTVVYYGGQAMTSKVISSTSIQASGTATTAQIGTKVPITVTNTGLGGTSAGPVNLSITSAPAVTVSVSPSSASVAVTKTQSFTATVKNATNTGVTWMVNGVPGGSSSTGTISTSGVYTAPATVPSPATVTVQAASAQSPSAVGSSTVTVTPPAPPPVTVSVSPNPITVAPAATQQFTATVTNTSNTAVTWSVNGTAGGSAAAGTISATGLYTAPGTPPSPATVTVTATSAASASASGSASVSIVGPPNPGTGQGTANLAAGRFLEQATFGPGAADIANLHQIGIYAWLTEQFNSPEKVVVDP
jgi:hypothetical protein